MPLPGAVRRGPRDAPNQRAPKAGTATVVHYRPTHPTPLFREGFGCTIGIFRPAEPLGDMNRSLPFAASLAGEDLESVARGREALA